MQLVRGLDNLRVRLPGCVATIGNFDGVHLGHREMVREVKRHAVRLGLPAVVITFEPSPREYFAHGGVVPARLTRLREKVAALADLGVDCLVLLRFNAQMAQVSPQAFVDDVLVGGLGVRHLVVGHDFRFAHRRAGSVDTLRELGQTRGFAVEEVAPFQFEGERNEAGGETAEPLLEVHVFDFAGDLYRRCLHVDFVAKLRDERWFPSLDALTVQMHEDARQARDILGGRTSVEK
jgi:FAD synthase